MMMIMMMMGCWWGKDDEETPRSCAAMESSGFLPLCPSLARWIPAWVVAAWSGVLRYSVRILACVQLSVRVCIRGREGE